MRWQRSLLSRCTRRFAATAWLLLAAGSIAPIAAADDGFYDTVRERARQLAEREFTPRPVDDLPEWLAKLDFDGYRKLRFRSEMSLWSGDGLPFRARFMHRGYLFGQRVPMSVVEGASVVPLVFSPAQFDYTSFTEPPVSDALGYSGFAICGAIDASGHCAELASFQGASYFRTLGLEQTYGASLRGLAVDTASPKGEEFPEFVEFWIERPASKATTITIHALLDSPSVTGAYRFVLTPGAETRIDVHASLFPRRAVEKLGLAPLTSMFLFDEQSARVDDWRPEVHDSDGLLIANVDGTWTWRKLSNPARTHRVTRFETNSPVGFGLLQRDRDFASYEDLESRFENRPSYWVIPRSGFTEGAVELVEIPSPAEWNDNVVAYWVPKSAPAKGQEISIEYSVSALAASASLPPLARLSSARTRAGKDAHLFVLDFTGPGLGADLSAPSADIAPSRGNVRSVVVQRNPSAESWRCSFELVDTGAEPMDVRVTLRRDGAALSETVVVPWTKP
jgi:glucans biosynthesis protein